MMDLSKILSVSGKPGLYRMLTQTKSGFIVESLADGKRFPVFAHERISSLEEISIFTTAEEDLPLKDVFRIMYDKLNGQQGPDAKSQESEVKKFFSETIPDYDAERVYISDMKKAVSWYNILLEKDLLDFTEEPKDGDQPGDKIKTEENEAIKDAGEKDEKS